MGEARPTSRSEEAWSNATISRGCVKGSECERSVEDGIGRNHGV
jgi:hypothetical protein